MLMIHESSYKNNNITIAILVGPLIRFSFFWSDFNRKNSVNDSIFQLLFVYLDLSWRGVFWKKIMDVFIIFEKKLSVLKVAK